MKNFKIFLVLSLFVLLFSCDENHLKIDVSSVSITPVKINRMEQDLFKLDTIDIVKSSNLLEQKYGMFYQYFITGIINKGGVFDTSHQLMIKRFISDKDMRAAYNDCNKMYPSVDELEEQFTDAFKHYRYYFPEKKLPQVITMMSGFNQWNVSIDSTLAIGLEMYLGSKNEFYQMLGIPVYKTRFMNKENIVPDAVRNWAIKQFPYNMNKNDFLSDMIYMGKIMYLCDAMMPEINDTLKIQYTQSQMDYCTQNEFNVWSYFVAQKLVYTTDQAEIMKFTSDGPFTSALSKNAPPRIAYWVGWQIVKQYMIKNKEITMEQLMNENDAQKILNSAKYKPKR